MSDTEAGTVSMVGQRLRTAREAKGLALQDVANQTRIPVRHLQHIEDGNWSALPAPTYSIGFARSYANAVGLNGNEVAAELRTEIGSPRPTYQAPQSYYEPADPARVPPKSIAMLAGLIALLLVGGYLIWRSMAVGDPDPAQVAVADTPPPAAQPQQQPLAQPQQATGPVVLTATEEVWLRVYEAGGGASLFQGILKPGQTFQVPATAQAPQIRTGRPQALRVTVGNQQIPPLGAPEQTINDVSLKPADLVARA
ncbi:MAG TPA: RodZ domain-containing protein, partial [Allosphingosinicella sp.]|nr:RodZ domain-containing protein [Allosphingosinicella sp.]